MSAQVTNKFEIFNDTDGTPLDNGYVYIGTAGYVPTASPIVAYIDVALTIPISQPIRTIGGYMVNNGVPVKVYVSGDFSILVKDKQGGLVYSSLSDNIDSISTLLLSSPVLGGVPTAPTAADGTDTTQIATTEFVLPTLQRGSLYTMGHPLTQTLHLCMMVKRLIWCNTVY
jgi:hypothetical protein